MRITFWWKLTKHVYLEDSHAIWHVAYELRAYAGTLQYLWKRSKI